MLVRDRHLHEAKFSERSAAASKAPGGVTISVKSSVEPPVLGHLARYVLQKTTCDVTYDGNRSQITRKICNTLNGHVPDVKQLIREGLQLDLHERYVNARVSKY